MNDLLQYILAVSIIVLIPGPNTLLIMNNSMKHGVRKGFFTILGNMVGMILLFIVSLSGIAAILILFSSLFTVIKWL